MNPRVTRREFMVKSTMAAAVVSGLDPGNVFAQANAPAGTTAARSNIALVDTNVHLFDWPFRRLKYSRTPALVEKLRHHGVQRAWAGSFEGVLTKDIAGANLRLVDECRREGAGLLVPFGSVNPTWPDWEDDLRRCHEVHHMAGIRLHPGYHGYSLESDVFSRLLRLATERGMLVQIVLEMEDPRVQHPQLKAPTITPAPLVALLPRIPKARVQLLNSWQWTRQPEARTLLGMENVSHDIAGLEGVGSIGRMLDGRHWYFGGKVPIERIVFGSHAPFFPVEATLIRMFESPLTLTQMRAIMETNASRLLAVA